MTARRAPPTGLSRAKGIYRSGGSAATKRRPRQSRQVRGLVVWRQELLAGASRSCYDCSRHKIHRREVHTSQRSRRLRQYRPATSVLTYNRHFLTDAAFRLEATDPQRIPKIPRMTRAKSLAFGLFVVLFSFGAAALTCEWLLGRLGYRPTPRTGNVLYSLKAPYQWAELDPVIGWRNKQGTSISLEPGHVQMTFWSHGRRATRPSPELREGPQTIVLGDSITQGHGIVDAETYAYLVQQSHPDRDIENFGTGGYGAYQSLLTLRKLYAERQFDPKLVVYAFADFHATRDVADYSSWVIWFRNSKGEYFAPPSVTVKDNSLVEHPLTVYRAWPLEHDLRLVAASKMAYLWLIYGDRARHEDEATKLLISEMRRLSEDHGATFLVLQLTKANGNIEKFLSDSGVALADCMAYDPSLDLTASVSKVGGVGHPSGRVHASWAECFNSWIARAH
jgi:hypothetical protein